MVVLWATTNNKNIQYFHIARKGYPYDNDLLLTVTY